MEIEAAKSVTWIFKWHPLSNGFSDCEGRFCRRGPLHDFSVNVYLPGGGERAIFSMPSRKTTFDDLQGEQRSFNGPPAPPLIPKMTSASEREAVYRMMLENLAARIAVETEASETYQETDD
jgi:hypothetical protein